MAYEDDAPSDFMDPEWGYDWWANRVHDWRNYISKEVRQMWQSFTPEQRAALARQADEQAGKEEWD